MDEGGSPALEVGFEIAFGDSFAELLRLNDVIDSATASAIKEFAAVERASRGVVNVGGSIAQMNAFANAASRGEQTIRQEKAATEKSIEDMIKQLDRQTQAVGRTRDEQRAARAEELALTATRQDNTDAADRLAASLRALGLAQTALAEDKLAAEEKAAAAALRERERAEAAVIAQLVERNRLETALGRTVGSDRPRATDVGATFSALEARAAEQEAIAKNAAAAATQRLAREHELLAAKVRDSHAAQLADADAAERLRMSTDPLYAATSRLNAEIAESTRLYYAGATAPTEYARQQEVLANRLQDVERRHNAVNQGFGAVGASGKLAGHHVQNLAFQFQDLGVQMAMAAQSGRPFSMAMMALFQQGTQINGIMSQAGLSAGGLARQVGAMILPFAGAAAAAGLLGAALLGVKQSAASDAEMQKFAAGLGLTRKEMKQLDDVTVTWGDTMSATFSVLLETAGYSAAGVKTFFADAFQKVGDFGKFSVQLILGAFAGAVRGIEALFSNVPGIIGNAAVGAANLAIAAFEKMVNFGIAATNRLGGAMNSILGTKIAPIGDVELGRIETRFKGTFANVGKAARDGLMTTFREVEAEFGRISARSTKNARDRLSKQAAGIIADRTPKAPEKPKVDRHAEQLAREAAAVEAQIRNLYALADAYRVSGAAALIAEARVKAESEAIKKRGNIEEFVNRQVRLAIAQRVSDAAKAAAAMREQARVQAEINAAVAAGNVPAGQAAELLRERVAELPLLAAIEAAQQRGLTTEVERATQALQDQREAQQAAKAAATGAFFVAADQDADRQMAMLREQLRLVSATEEVRVRALATLRATQELQARGESLGTPYADNFIAKQVSIAAMSAELSTARSEADLLLGTLTGIADQASATAETMGSAFGQVGDVFGGMLENLAGYQVARQQLAIDVVKGSKTQAEADRALGVLQARNTTQAIAGIKSLFKEHSTAYKVMGAIEKAHAALQLINTIRSIAMDSAKTASSVANSGARAAADGVAAIAKAIASLPFPLNIAAGAATAAALVAFGVKVFGGGGGGQGAVPPTSAEDLQAAAGTGTVLGDSKAKSESIARSLEIVAANTSADLQFANPMLKAMQSIDRSIARMAGSVARQIQVAGGMFDTSGQNLGTNSKAGFLGLFGGSTTTRSLYDLGMTLNSGSVADIIANGISGETYQVIEKVKKKKGFLGLGGGTKTSYDTTYGAIDGEITSAVQSVILSLRNGLLSAAGAIGMDGAEAILNGFQVSIGQVSFKDMTGEQIENQLNSIFSSVGDHMAGQLLPSLKSMQLVGEGMFETFIRVAKEYESVDVALRLIGRSFGAVGIESVAARDALVQLFGGLDDFMEKTSSFRSQFLSEAEQIGPVVASVSAELGRLGLTGAISRERFKQAVLGLDLTTAAGREMYASLLALAPAFDKVLDYQEQAQKATVDGLKSTADQFTKFAESLRKYRDTLFANEAAGGDAYAALRARYNSTADLAAGGDQKALGELEAAGKAFLDASMNNASTREQYQRDVAVVARGVDAGIFAAEATADYAKLQLDALDNAVTILGAISASSAATAAAVQSTAFVEAASTNSAATGPSSSASNEALVSAMEEMRLELAQLRADSNSGFATVAGHTGRTARILDDVTADSGGTRLSTL